MAIRTKGTHVWVVREDSNGYEVIQIGCPTGVSGLGGAKPQIDTTCLDSEEREFVPGLANPGAVTINLNYDPTVVSHRELWELFENDRTVTFVIGLSDGVSVPTVDSAGTITFPTTRTFIEFDGYVADFPLDLSLDAVTTSAISIQRTGARTAHYKV